jgi:hypothetical protein
MIFDEAGSGTWLGPVFLNGVHDYFRTQDPIRFRPVQYRFSRDLKEAARKRQAFTVSQAEQLRFGYSRPFQGEKVITLGSVTE